MSNLKQIGLAMLMYAQDYDERFPPYEVNYGPSAEGNQIAFAPYDSIYPYINNEQVYICPSGDWNTTGSTSHGGSPQRGGFPRTGPGVFSTGVLASYSVLRDQTAADRVTPTAFNTSGRRMAQFVRPAETILVFETIGYYLATRRNVGFSAEGAPHSDLGRMAYRHNQQMNIAYADGHVKSSPQLTDLDAFRPY